MFHELYPSEPPAARWTVMVDKAKQLDAKLVRLPDGRDLAYAVYGNPAGTPVLAFHGSLSSRLDIAYGTRGAIQDRILGPPWASSCQKRPFR